MTFTVRWPDGTVQSCYSPSLVVHEHLAVGQAYDLADFVERSRTALTIASERVRDKYGFFCTASAESLARIEQQAEAFDGGTVSVEAFSR